jgi:hypothetical protein
MPAARLREEREKELKRDPDFWKRFLAPFLFDLLASQSDIQYEFF